VYFPIRAAAVAALTAVAATGIAQDKKADGPTADPKDTPLVLKIAGEKTEYTLDTGGLTPAEYKKAIEDALDPKNRKKIPPPPKVDLTVELTSSADKPVQVWTKGDPVVLELELKGKGAVNASPPLAVTLEFRIPEASELAPGKKITFPVKSLTSGFRGITKYSYWTAPGEYELIAKLKTGMQPAPKGAKDLDGFGVVNLTSAPFQITVKEK
jgi:hypothetical protein